MEAGKDKVWRWDTECLSLHGYTIPNNWDAKGPSVGFDESEYAKGLKATLQMDDWIVKQSAIMDRYDPEKKLGLYVDECGLWPDPTRGTNPRLLHQQNPLSDALIAAVHLNIFMRHADRVRGTNIAQMAYVLRAIILTDGAKMVLTPTYHVYHMYVPFQDATYVPVRFDAGSYAHGDIRLPRVDAVAARDAAGKLWLSLVNVDPARPARITTAIAGVSAESAAGLVLTGTAVDSHNSFANPSEVAPRPYRGRATASGLAFDLPPKSIVVVEVR